MPLNLQAKINFGKKHKNKSIETALAEDPEWIVWATKNVSFFKVDDDVKKAIEDNRYFKCKDCKSLHLLEDKTDIEDHLSSSGACKYCGGDKWGIFNAAGELVG